MPSDDDHAHVSEHAPDRRYRCTGCGLKWFIHGRDRMRPDLTVCEACGAALRPLQHEGESAA